MKTTSITNRDFDKAVAKKWSTETCLLAQASIRLFGNTERMYDLDKNEAHDAMNLFDAQANHLPATTLNAALKQLRASLPIKVKL